MKLAKILLLSLCLASCQTLDSRYEKPIQALSYLAVGKSVEYYVKQYPQNYQYVLDISSFLQEGTLDIESAQTVIEKILTRADVPALEREALFLALWDSVDSSSLNLSDDQAAYVTTIGKFAELGANAGFLGGK